MNEMLRFTLVRPPKRLPATQWSSRLIKAYPDGLSPFAVSLVSQDPGAAARSALEYVRSKDYVSDLGQMGALGALDVALLPPFVPEVAGSLAAVSAAFRMSARDLVSREDFRQVRRRLADSLLAAAHASLRRAPGQEQLVRGIQLCAFVESLASGASRRAEVEAALSGIVVLPRGAVTQRPPAATGSTPPVPQELSDLRSIRAAVSELELLLRRKRIAAKASISGATKARKSPDVLSKAEWSKLSASTQAVLASLDVDPSGVRLPLLIDELRDYMNTLLSNPVFRLRPLWVPTVPLFPVPAGPVPTSTGRVRIAGLGDLMIVRERTKRYELGEIAHVENALRGESFGRSFRRKEATEVMELEEVETQTTSERDLQSTSKSELKTEAERTLQEDLKFEAGLDVTVTGPMVEVGANAGFSYDRSAMESNKTATTFARDVVDRTVNRIQERVLKSRSTKTTREVEETSDHRIDNTTGSEHMVGVYRWIDKVHEMQVVSYGQRLILEFVVPEPAAFYRMSVDNRRVPGIQEAPPRPPQILDEVTGALRPLRVDDIDEGNYLSWVSELGVPGAVPAPALETFISVALEQGARDGSVDSTSRVLEQGGLKVEPGYVAREIRLDWAGDYDATTAHWEVIVGTHEFKSGMASGPMGDHLVVLGQDDAYDGFIPVSMVCKQFGAFTVNVVVRCERTPARLEQWRLQTFRAIMSRYETLNAEYQDRVTAVRIQGTGADLRRRPDGNRELERNELKRLSVAMLSGQNFDLFDAMRDSGEPLRYPEVTQFAEAQAEGEYIQFLEQAIEWRYMSYVFYPYFWGRKSGWVDTLNQQDADPQFLQFLRAGAARVQVPVRPGFVEAMRYFLEKGRPWNGGDPPQFEDTPDANEPPFLPIVQELREQTGNGFEDGPGRLVATPGSTQLTGVGTNFVAARDTRREIRIRDQVYCIARVDSLTEIELMSPFAGVESGEFGYSLGATIVGQPWEVRVPTTLVMVQADTALPSW